MPLLLGTTANRSGSLCRAALRLEVAEEPLTQLVERGTNLLT